jgi:ACS family pantothenate transporter-like MFS transporter
MLSQRVRDYLHTEYQPGEATLIRKIDFFILTFCCLSYFINYVRDQQSFCRLSMSRVAD